MDSVVFPALPTYLFDPSLAGLLSLALTVLLPLLAALFMRSSWSAWPKGLVLLVFAAVKVFLEAWYGAVVDHEPFHAAAAAYTVAVQWVLAVAAYVGLLRGTRVQQAAIASGPVRDLPGGRDTTRSRR